MSLSHAEPRSVAGPSRSKRTGSLDRLPPDAPLTGLDFLLSDIDQPRHVSTDEDLDLRQLRHHTKNALQRIIGLVGQIPGLSDTPQGEHIARELENRIRLSAAVSDALFGLTRAPDAMTERLRSLCGNLVELLREPSQVIQVGVSVRGECPPTLREVVLRVAHELVANAVKHGMRRRPRGRITVRLHTEPGVCTRLTVIDDGNGFHGKPVSGEGLSVAELLTAQHGGRLSLQSDGRTVAALDLPHRRQS